jgi:ATP synthase H subunit
MIADMFTHAFVETESHNTIYTIVYGNGGFQLPFQFSPCIFIDSRCIKTSGSGAVRHGCSACLSDLTIWGVSQLIRSQSFRKLNQEGYEPVIGRAGYRVITIGMANVLDSIKDAEESADAKIANSKVNAAKVLADARKEASDIIQNAQDGAVTSTAKTLDSARNKAGKEADGVQAEGTKIVEGIQSSAGEQRTAAVQLVIDSLMSN